MEVQSYIFDFKRVPSFFENWNIQFTVNEMQLNSNKFQIVYCTHAPSNIYDCLNGGVLSSDVTVGASIDLSLKYEDDTISVRNDCTWNAGTTVYSLKAIFIRHKGSGYVMGYSINNVSFDVSNTVKLEAGTVLWSFEDG